MPHMYTYMCVLGYLWRWPIRGLVGDSGFKSFRSRLSFSLWWAGRWGGVEGRGVSVRWRDIQGCRERGRGSKVGGGRKAVSCSVEVGLLPLGACACMCERGKKGREMESGVYVSGSVCLRLIGLSERCGETGREDEKTRTSRMVMRKWWAARKKEETAVLFGGNKWRIMFCLKGECSRSLHESSGTDSVWVWSFPRDFCETKKS